MGRYVTPSGGEGGAGMRNLRMIFTASNPAVAVPSWAKIVRVTGCGGGGGGGIADAVAMMGKSGGAGGIANGAPLLLGAATTVAVVVGAAGAGRATGKGDGGAGGDTTVTVPGGQVMTLKGANGFQSGAAYIGTTQPAAAYADWRANAGLFPGFMSPGFMEHGAGSPFGALGVIATAGGGDGGHATGYGAGGGVSVDGKGGNGSPGIVILEFQEAVV